MMILTSVITCYKPSVPVYLVILAFVIVWFKQKSRFYHSTFLVQTKLWASLVILIFCYSVF